MKIIIFLAVLMCCIWGNYDQNVDIVEVRVYKLSEVLLQGWDQRISTPVDTIAFTIFTEEGAEYQSPFHRTGYDTIVIQNDSLNWVNGEMQIKIPPIILEKGDYEITVHQRGIAFYDTTGGLDTLWGNSVNSWIVKADIATSVEMLKIKKEKTSLNFNYPNPFNQQTKISFFVKQKTNVKLELYDIRGKKVQTILDKVYDRGAHTVRYTARRLSTGTYICKMITDDYVGNIKVFFIK
jgi:hypothetical protein